MLIEVPRHAEIFGSVKIYDVQKALKLESKEIDAPLLRSIGREQIEWVLERLSIIIPADVITHFHNLTKHPICIIHQKDTELALAFKEVGYISILDESGFVRDGKAEGMITGTLLAKCLEKRLCWIY